MTHYDRQAERQVERPHDRQGKHKLSLMHKLMESTGQRPRSPPTTTTPPHSPSLLPTPAVVVSELSSLQELSPTPSPPMVERKLSFRDMLKSGARSFVRSKSNDFAPSHSGHDSPSAAPSNLLAEKYGVCDKACIGKGATAIVKLAHKLQAGSNEEKTYAVKEFRKRRKNESEKDYIKKLTAEFCISSSLHHINIVETIDLIQDENQHWCEVMEYCSGGDLYSIIKGGHMSSDEINCCFKQLVTGVHYLHTMGVAHRDLKPENLLLDADGHLKITDFGVSEVFRMCWESEPHMSKGVCGSEPYIAPEEFSGSEYDAREVDVWACGIVFYAMIYQGIPWRHATKDDSNYAYFLAHRNTHFEALDRLEAGCRNAMYSILEPDPRKRITIDELVKTEWFKNIRVCFDCTQSNVAAVAGIKNHVHHTNVHIGASRSRSGSATNVLPKEGHGSSKKDSHHHHGHHNVFHHSHHSPAGGPPAPYIPATAASVTTAHVQSTNTPNATASHPNVLASSSSTAGIPPPLISLNAEVDLADPHAINSVMMLSSRRQSSASQLLQQPHLPADTAIREKRPPLPSTAIGASANSTAVVSSRNSSPVSSPQSSSRGVERTSSTSSSPTLTAVAVPQYLKTTLAHQPQTQALKEGELKRKASDPNLAFNRSVNSSPSTSRSPSPAGTSNGAMGSTNGNGIATPPVAKRNLSKIELAVRELLRIS